MFDNPIQAMSDCPVSSILSARARCDYRTIISVLAMGL